MKSVQIQIQRRPRLVVSGEVVSIFKKFQVKFPVAQKFVFSSTGLHVYNTNVINHSYSIMIINVLHTKIIMLAYYCDRLYIIIVCS